MAMPPSLSEPLVRLKTTSLQSVVSWLHSVVQAFSSNLEAEKRLWDSQAQELRAEGLELRRRVQDLESGRGPDTGQRPESVPDLGEQLRELERRLDRHLGREELRSSEERLSSARLDGLQQEISACLKVEDMDAVRQDLRRSLDALVEDKAQEVSLHLKQQLADSSEQLSEMLQAHSSAQGERLRICEDRLAKLAFGALQATEPQEEDQRRPGSTGSGCSNAGGASVESRVARLERNFKGLAAWASTGDAQRLEEVAAAAKQAQADARRWSERVQQLEARLSLPAPANSAQSVEPLGDDRALALERHLYELDAEVRQLQENLPSRISEDEKVHSGILEEVHRDLLGPVAASSRGSLLQASPAASLVASPEMSVEAKETAAEVAALRTKLQALTKQQDDRSWHLEQELRKLEQELRKLQLQVQLAGGAGEAGEGLPTSSLAMLASHDEELKNLAASVATLAARKETAPDATAGAVQRAEQAERRVASLANEVARLAQDLAKVAGDQNPQELDKETLQDVRKDLLDMGSFLEEPEDSTAAAADAAAPAEPAAPAPAQEDPRTDPEGVLQRLEALEAKAAEAQAAPAQAEAATAGGCAEAQKALERCEELERQVKSLERSPEGKDEAQDSGPAPVGGEELAKQVADLVASLQQCGSEHEELRSEVQKLKEMFAKADSGSKQEAAEADAATKKQDEEASKEQAAEAEAAAKETAAEAEAAAKETTAEAEAASKELAAEAEAKQKAAEAEAAAKETAAEAEAASKELAAEVKALKQKAAEAEAAAKEKAAEAAAAAKELAAEELKDLRLQVETLAAEVQSHAQLLEALKAEQPAEALREELQTLQGQVQGLQESRAQAQRLEAEQAKLTQRLQQLAPQVERLGSVDDLREQVRRLEADKEGREGTVARLRDSVEALKRRQEESRLEVEGAQRAQLASLREEVRTCQATQEALANRQAQAKEGHQSLEKEQLQLASKLRQLETIRLKQLDQDMKVVKETVLHVQQELQKEVVIPEHILRDLDAKNEKRLESVWAELRTHAEAAATRADKLEQNITLRIVNLERSTTTLAKSAEHMGNLEQEMAKQSEWFAWRIAWLEWATSGEKRSFARLIPPPATPAATCFKQPLTEDSELWAQEKTGNQRLRRAPITNLPNVSGANSRSAKGSASAGLSVSSSAPDLHASGKLPDLR